MFISKNVLNLKKKINPTIYVFIKHGQNIMKRDRMLTQTVSHATSKNQEVLGFFFSVFSICFVQNICDQSDQQRGTMHVLVAGSWKCIAVARLVDQHRSNSCAIPLEETTGPEAPRCAEFGCARRHLQGPFVKFKHRNNCTVGLNVYTSHCRQIAGSRSPEPPLLKAESCWAQRTC